MAARVTLKRLWLDRTTWIELFEANSPVPVEFLEAQGDVGMNAREAESF